MSGQIWPPNSNQPLKSSSSRLSTSKLTSQWKSILLTPSVKSQAALFKEIRMDGLSSKLMFGLYSKMLISTLIWQHFTSCNLSSPLPLTTSKMTTTICMPCSKTDSWAKTTSWSYQPFELSAPISKFSKLKSRSTSRSSSSTSMKLFTL